MRWCLALAFMLISSAAQATIWVCDAALSTQDTVLGISDMQFRLALVEGGRFSARAMREQKSYQAWSWSGHWIETEEQIAMIGHARSSYDDPILVRPASTTQEVRAFSLLFQDDVIVLNLQRHTYPDTMVRCLRREH
ncbi:hypothetical protein [uncultured Tateyamaria sp.]|uniref:hypothetical protein n=2 Tax=uncultured Tateyamaria sp. TaxID=455651 RepID=UPI002617BB36|nr:hypothetical protein [uncultured Tateyamaria sp.]